MSKQSCLIIQLAELLQAEGRVKALWIDRLERRVSLALGPGRNGLTKELTGKVESLIREHHDCWINKCEACNEDLPQQLPEGFQLIPMPDSGIMVKRETCPTGPQFWRWTEVKASVRRQAPAGEHTHEEWKHGLVLSGLCLAFIISALAADRVEGLHSTAPIILYVLGYLAGGWHPAEEAFGLLRKRVLDIHFLMLCVAVGAAFIGHWWEGGILLFLFSLSGALEELAEARTEKEIRSLFRDAPRHANRLLEDGTESPTPVDEIQPGMVLRVRPGEQFAVDGKIIQGTTAVNEANLTGESLPVEKGAGQEVFSGTMNLWGAVDYRASRRVTESALAKVIHLIKEARESKAPSQRFTECFGSRYTYAVLGVCTVMFFVWWLAFGLPPLMNAGEVSSAFYRAMTLLVVASPCALVLSIPSAILAGIAAGARRGVLFRGGAAIERLAEASRFVFDKTGTLTTGALRVQSIEGAGEEEALGMAASLAHYSAHPVSRAIVREALGRSEEFMSLTAEDVRDLPGMGVEGAVAGSIVRLGNRQSFANEKTSNFSAPPAGYSEVFVEWKAGFARFLLVDELRPTARNVIAWLQKQGLKVSMLTGDRSEAAGLVASELGINDMHHSLKPEGKVSLIQDWSQNQERIVMVGDGVNDAPGFAAADIAVGMGLRGADASLEQADVVLMKDRLENLLFAYSLSKRARRIIRQNLAISLGVIVLLVFAALGGSLPLTLGVVGHEGSTVVVVLNSLRLLFRGNSSDSGFDAV